jgi:hypothetical protein
MVLAATAVLGLVYLIFFKDRDDLMFYFGLALTILVVTYVFQFQLDQLMTRGVPLKLNKAMHDMLMHTAPHFTRMSTVQQHMIEDRMMRWITKKEFINQNDQDAPEDVKFILAYYAALMTLHQEAYNYEGLDRIVFYHHPFLSPHLFDEVHIAEIEKEDGTLIISVPHLLKGHLEKGYYNIALHLMAEAYYQLYIKEPVQWDIDIWDQLEKKSGISKESIDNYIGIPVTNPWPVAVHHQLMFLDVHIPEVISRLPQFAGNNIMVA